MSRAADQRSVAQAVWATALRLGSFTYYALAAEAHVNVDTAMTLVQDWRRSGAVITLGKGDGNRLEFRVAADMPDLPRRTRADGTFLRAGTAQGNMWRAMRGLGAFTPTDLAAHSNTPDVQVTVEDARAYCQMLVRSGHLRVQRKGLSGRRDTIYRLARNTGPHAPTERRVRAVWDENLKEYAHIADGSQK